MQTKAVITLLFILSGYLQPELPVDRNYTSYVTRADKINMYWKKDGKIINNFKELKKMEPRLQFAMNGGMFDSGYSPVGLYVENGKELKKLKKVNNPNVNFGLQPQGIFLIRADEAAIVSVQDYTSNMVIYATQSAPVLIINSAMNPALPVGKKYIRNGVGILPDGKVLMAVSKVRVNFHEFARFFIDHKCVSALYLDGAISEAYTGSGETYGSFGVMIGVVE